MRMSETIKPYRAKASPKISIRIKPTNKRYCWAFALIPASPTFPIEYPAAWVDKSVRCSWIRKLDLKPCGNSHFSWDSHHLAWLDWSIDTSLTDDDSDNHAVDTQDTGHDDRNEWFHDNSWPPDRDATDASSCFCSSIGSSEVYLWDWYWQEQGPCWLPWSQRRRRVLQRRERGKVRSCWLDLNWYDYIWLNSSDMQRNSDKKV